MNFRSVHTTLTAQAKQGGFMPSYWSAISNVNSNDRLPEITRVPEDRVK
jgi:hypothetical protein